MAVEMENASSLWLGVDLGTTSVKLALVNICGEIVCSQTRPTLAECKSSIGALGFEQSPRQIFVTVEDLLLPVFEQYKDRVKGIGITGQMHGVVMWRPVGEDDQEMNKSLGTVLESHCSNLYTWQDQRCSSQFLETLPSPSDPFQSLSTGHGCATMFWLARNQPQFFKDGQFTCCGTIMDYLVTVLCGLRHSVTSDQLAASLGYFDRCSSTWDSALLKDEEFPSCLLPKIVPAGTVIGHVTDSLSGWPVGVPVMVGMGDVQCAMYAILQGPRDAAVNISTSIQLGFIIPAEDTEQVRQQSPATISFFPYFDGRQLALCAGLNGGNAIQYFAQCLASWISDLGFDECVDVGRLLQTLQNLAQESAAHEDVTHPLTFHPVFFGERHDTATSGHISGLTATNFGNIGRIFRAACEGIVDHLHQMVSAHYLLTRGINQLLVTGSVPVSNCFVRQRLVDLYTSGHELSVVIGPEGTDAISSAIGAAKFVKDCTKN